MGKRFPLEIVIGATDRASAALRRITDRIDRFYQPFGRMRAAFKSFSERSGLSAVGGALSNVARSAYDVTRRIVYGFTAASAAVAAFTYRLAMGADEIGDTAARLNVSTRALQAWIYGFNQADVAPEQLTSALDTLNKNLGLASVGMGRALPLFRGLGIDPKKFKTVDELLPVLAERLSRIRDPARRAGIATRFLGDAGAQMAVTLAKGPKALEAMMAAALKAGAIIDGSVIEAAGDLDMRLKALRGTLAGVAGNVMGKLYPALIKIAEAVAVAVVKYQPQIEAFAKQFAENLPRYIKNTRDAFAGLWRAIKPVVDLIGLLFDKFGAGNTVMAAFAVLIGAKLIASLVSLGFALTSLGVSLSVAFGVPGLIVAGVAAIVLAGWWLYKNWDKVSMAIGDSIDWMVDKFSRAWKFIKDAGAAAFEFLSKIYRNSPLGLLFRGMSWLGGKFAESSAANSPVNAAPIGGRLLQPGAGVMRSQVDVSVDLSNLPAGTRTRASASDGVRLDLSRGFAMPGVR